MACIQVRVIGPSDGGKTTLIEQLIPILKARGKRVATIKHAHKGFDMDIPGKDSWRHLKAGASSTAVIGPGQFALFQVKGSAPQLQQALEAHAQEADVILIEGFKSDSGRRIVLDLESAADVIVDGEICTLSRGIGLDQVKLAAVADFCLNE